MPAGGAHGPGTDLSLRVGHDSQVGRRSVRNLRAGAANNRQTRLQPETSAPKQIVCSRTINFRFRTDFLFHKQSRTGRTRATAVRQTAQRALEAEEAVVKVRYGCLTWQMRQARHLNYAWGLTCKHPAQKAGLRQYNTASGPGVNCGPTCRGGGHQRRGHHGRHRGEGGEPPENL